MFFLPQATPDKDNQTATLRNGKQYKDIVAAMKSKNIEIRKLQNKQTLQHLQHVNYVIYMNDKIPTCFLSFWDFRLF